MNSELTFISNITPRQVSDIFVLVDNIKTQLPNSINKIYVSFGGKYNAPDVQFSRDVQLPTNSLYQMFPCFLQAKETYEDDQCIIIVIDDFHSKPNLAENNHLLQSYQTDGVHVIMCNQYCTENFVTTFIEYLVEFAREHKVAKENLMICNYIKYINVPNDFERKSETIVPESIQQILDLEQNKFYSECFYEWFGYRRALYNYVYCYKLHRHIFMAIPRLERIIDAIDANPSTKIKFRDYNETNIWDKIYDITGYGIDKYRMSMSLRERFIFRNNLEYRADPPTIELQKV